MLLLACDAEPGRDGRVVDTDPTVTDSDTPDECVSDGPTEAPLRKLTNTEVDHSVEDLLGVPGTARTRLPPDPTVHGFDNNASTVGVSLLAADGYLRSAEDVTAAVDWTATLPCDPNGGDQACFEAFLDDFGRRAFRRPLDPAERQVFLDLFAAVRADDDFETSVALVVQAFLQSPQFLYRVELGDPAAAGAVVPLTAHELAARLSYLLWESTPDEGLLAAADAGTLTDPAVLADEVDRLLADPRARRVVSHFVEQWMGTGDLEAVPKDALAFPEWGTALAADLREETRRFTESVVFDGDGTLASLLTASETVVNGPVAAVYGLPGPADPTAWEPTPLPGDQRAGLLTQPGFLATMAHSNQTSVVHRGLFVYEQLWCGVQPDPPGDLDISLPPLDADLSTRERFARHTQDPVCAACHRVMDPVGLGFEHYDPIGRWRETEGDDVPIDASGTLHYGPNAGDFYGVVELAGLMAADPAVEACFATQWFRSAWGRDPGPDDACTVASLGEAFTGGDVLELLRAIPQTDTFRSRPRVTP